jgi:hypothetical protein
MADTLLQSDIFKFVSLRPPVSIEKNNFDTNFITDNRSIESTPVGKLAKSFDSKDGTNIPEQLKKFVESNKFTIDSSNNENEHKLVEISNYLSTITSANFTNASLLIKINDILGKPISKYLESQDSKKLQNESWDKYYAFYLLTKFQSISISRLSSNLQVFHFLNFIVNSKLENFSTFQRLISAKPIIPLLFVDLPAPLTKTEKSTVTKPNSEAIKEYKNLWNQLIDTHRAIDEIKTLKFDTKTTSSTKDIIMPNKETGIESKSKLLTFSNKIEINKKSFDNLHQNTRNILKEFNLNDSFQVAEPIGLLLEKQQNLYSIASKINDENFAALMPVEAISYSNLALFGNKDIYINDPLYTLPVQKNNIRRSIKPLGIGDLKVVKQTLKKYVAGEVAHIENVLRGEYKERKHRVLDRTEDIFSTSNETSEETTKDTQTTERFELKKESEKTVQEQMSVQAGVTVSGSYGMVTFGAHGDFAYSASSSESNKSASNFAREVIDKSVSKIQKKTKEERTTKKLHEVEEINTHGVDNKEKPDHVTGIYRWVDKHYEAQIYNYGKRMMFEFIIPEPAAFYEYANTYKTQSKLISPKKLDHTLTHKDITEYNFQYYIRDYNVQGVTLPPPFSKVITLGLTSDTKIENHIHFSKTSKELIVPQGYISDDFAYSLTIYTQEYPHAKVSIGADMVGASFAHPFNAGFRHEIAIPEIFKVKYDGVIPVSINLYDVNTFILNISVKCIRTDQLYQTWQIQTFEKIKTAYYAMQVEYEQKLAAQEYSKGIAITGQNPLINREIEKTELKKHCLKMLMDTTLFGSFNAMFNKATPAPENEAPDFDIFDALGEGKTIQFFEQAFEWENLTYLFYPYFWARKDQWIHKSTTYDNDPLFTKFLQAGSARVVLPVRPGFNDLVAHYMQTGRTWDQEGTPTIDGANKDLFMSIADELRNQSDDLAKAKPEGDSWEIVLPTTLVYLQKESDLPTF